jgi:hypothetical protein
MKKKLTRKLRKLYMGKNLGASELSTYRLMLNTNVCASVESDLFQQLDCFIRVTKLRSKIWARYVASMGDKTGVYRVMVWKLEGKNHWEDLVIVWRIGLKCVF